MKRETSLLALAAAAALPVVLFAMVMVYLYGREHAAVVEHGQRGHASAAATAVERQIASEFGVLNALATSETLDAPDLDAFRVQAQRALATRPAWLSIILTDRTRQLMNTWVPAGGPLPPLIDFGSLERTFATANPQVGVVQSDPGRYPEPFVMVRVPVTRNGTVRFTLTAALRAYALTELLRKQELPGDWRIDIVDQAGNVLARSPSHDPLDPVVGAPPSRSVRAGIGSGQSGIFEAVTSDGFDSTAAFVRSDLTGWTIIAGTSADEVAWLTRRSILLAAAGGGVAALAAAVLAWGQIRADRRRREAERLMDQVRTERVVADRLSDIAAHFPGIIYRRVLKDGKITYPYVSDHRRVFPDQDGRHTDGVDFHDALTARMTPESRERWEQALRASAETGAPYSVELEVASLDGERRILRSLAQTRREPDGCVIWDGLILDVTAQRDAEARSHVADERLRLAMSAADLGTFDLDIRTRGLIWSERCKTMFGLPPDTEVTGQVYLSRVHPDDVELVRRAEDGALDPASSGEYHVRFRARWPNGSIRWLEALGKVIFQEENGARIPTRLTGAVMDVTDRRNAEQALKDARDRAERANLSKSKFLAAASHDLRQPLQSLFLFSSTLHRHVDSEQGREQLMHLERGLDALKGLLDSLLDVSRIDAGIIRPEVEEFPASELLEEVATTYAPIAAGKGVTLEVRACAGSVRSDRTLLARMLRNLVENAVRYTRRGGVRLSCQAEGDALLIEVADTGIGIPPEHLDRIWEEFHQVGNPERDRTQGLGLGLAIVRRLSALLSLPVDVRSAPGRGSVFTIRVPASHARSAPDPRTPAVPNTGNGRYAVVVDDDAIVLLGLKAMFEEWGYRVLVSGSTDDAMAHLQTANRRPDIVVADYRLREGRIGTEAILRIRQRFGTDIPGIILTGETGPECQRDAAEHGLRVIHKPVTPRQLSQALERQMADAG